MCAKTVVLLFSHSMTKFILLLFNVLIEQALNDLCPVAI